MKSSLYTFFSSTEEKNYYNFLLAQDIGGYIRSHSNYWSQSQQLKLMQSMVKRLYPMATNKTFHKLAGRQLLLASLILPKDSHALFLSQIKSQSIVSGIRNYPIISDFSRLKGLLSPVLELFILGLFYQNFNDNEEFRNLVVNQKSLREK